MTSSSAKATPTAIGEALSAKVSNMGVLCMGFVVAIHVAGRELSGFAPGSLMWWWEALGHYGLFLVAVPFFFICSGYFLAGHVSESGWWFRECRKRIKSLFVPYVCWCLIFAMLGVGMYMVSNAVNGRPLIESGRFGWRFWAGVFGVHPFSSPRLFPLWYVRALLMFVALSPLLVRYLLKFEGGGAFCCISWRWALVSCRFVHREQVF